jgi:hypothetical protein
MSNTDFSISLNRLVPEAQWAMDDNDYENINWLSPEIAKPTIKALETAYANYLAEIQAKVDARTSALAKLAALGLTADEVAAL